MIIMIDMYLQMSQGHYIKRDGGYYRIEEFGHAHQPSDFKE